MVISEQVSDADYCCYHYSMILYLILEFNSYSYWSNLSGVYYNYCGPVQSLNFQVLRHMTLLSRYVCAGALNFYYVDSLVVDSSVLI